jgi:hypothetical protein
VPARRTLRTNLQFLARHVVPGLDPVAAPLPTVAARQEQLAALKQRVVTLSRMLFGTSSVHSCLVRR